MTDTLRDLVAKLDDAFTLPGSYGTLALARRAWADVKAALSASDTQQAQPVPIRPPRDAFDAAYESSFTQYARDENDRIEDETLESGCHRGIFGEFDLEIMFDAGWRAALAQQAQQRAVAAAEARNDDASSAPTPESLAAAPLDRTLIGCGKWPTDVAQFDAAFCKQHLRPPTAAEVWDAAKRSGPSIIPTKKQIAALERQADGLEELWQTLGREDCRDDAKHIRELLTIFDAAPREPTCEHQVCKNCGDNATVPSCEMNITCPCKEETK